MGSLSSSGSKPLSISSMKGVNVSLFLSAAKDRGACVQDSDAHSTSQTCS